jgi:hypothetical protein
MLRIKLDNRLLETSEHSDIDNGQITLRKRDENNETAVSFSETITFYGKAYEELRAKFATSLTPYDSVAIIEVFDECCNDILFYTGKIVAANVEWCGVADAVVNCSIKASSVESSKESEARMQLKNVLITADFNGFHSAFHPFVRHCVELRPSFMQNVVMILAILINILFIILTPLVALISVVKDIIDFVGAGFNVKELDGDFLTQYNEFKNDLNRNFIGCGRGHYSPYIRDYAQNACGQIGLTFESPIFTDTTSPYFNAVWFAAPNDKGSNDQNQGAKDKYWRLNAPNLNGAQFLDRVARIFNAVWYVDGTVVRLERKPAPTVLYDFTQPSLAAKVQSICVSGKSEYLPAYGRYSFAEDATDWAGNEAKYLYDDLIDFNTPPSSSRRGAKEVVLEISRARWRNDGVEPDVISSYRDNVFINDFLGLNKFDKYLLLPLHLSASPKILIVEPSGSSIFNPNPLDPTFAGNFTAVTVDGGAGTLNYNYPMWFASTSSIDAGKGKRILSPNLYDSFYKDDDPRFSPSLVNRNFTIDFIYDCDNLPRIAALRENSSVIFFDSVANKTFTGKVREITIRRNTISITGEI